MKPRQKIRLDQGQEILVNGFIIRAIGNAKKPEGLSIAHPETFAQHRDDRETPGKHIYAGISDTVLCSSVMCVGLVEDLAKAETPAAKTAREHLALFPKQ